MACMRNFRKRKPRKASKKGETKMINYKKTDLNTTDQGYPIYKKLGFEDKVQKYTDMRIKFV